MNIIYFGKGIRGRLCLKKIIEVGFKVVLCVTESEEDCCHDYAAQIGIERFVPISVNSLDTENRLKKLNSDVFVLCGYSKIIKKNIIKIPKITTLNLHAGALPSYRGAAPINWQIINGEKQGGCCIIEVDEGIDTGPVLLQEKYEIKLEDTHFSVLDKTLKIFPNMLLKVLLRLNYYLKKKKEQNVNEGSYYGKRYPKDSILNWSFMSSVEVYNLVRGMYGPYQWAYSYYNDTKVEFTTVKLYNVKNKVEPGKISDILNEGALIHCNKNAILAKNVKVDGKIIDARKFFIKNSYLVNNV